MDNFHNITQNTLESFWNCFIYGINHKLFDLNYKCNLDGIEIILNHATGKGCQGTVYSLTINSTEYVLKHSFKKDLCYHIRREWTTLQLLGFNQSSIIPLYKKLPNLYEITQNNQNKHCFIILEYVNNSISMNDILEYHSNNTHNDKLHKTSLNKLEKLFIKKPNWMTDGNKLIEFILSCYNDIKITLDTLQKEELYYADEYIHNVLLDVNTYKCILIDYGLIAELKDTVDILTSWEHLDHNYKFSPYSHFFLHDFKSRKHVLESYLFIKTGLNELRKLSVLNSMHKLASLALQIFATFYIDIVKNSKYYHLYVDDKSFNTVKEINNKLYDLRYFLKKRGIYQLWRKRNKQINLIKIQIKRFIERNQIFDKYLGEQFLNILTDIHTDQTMKMPLGFKISYPINRHLPFVTRIVS